MKKFTLKICCIVLLVVAAPSNLYANSLEKRVEQLERRLDALEYGTNKSGNKTKSVSTEIGSGGWKNKANWRALRNGMTENEVRQLLGEAGKISSYSSFVRWYYDYPSGGSVTFEPKSMTVNEWSE